MQQLEALAKMAPTKEEEDELSKYQGDIDELSSAEKFVKAILDIPFAFSRIRVMLYKETFEDEVVHLRKSFAMLEVGLFFFSFSKFQPSWLHQESLLIVLMATIRFHVFSSFRKPAKSSGQADFSSYCSKQC